MSIRIKYALAFAIFFWASAFVGIRAALHSYAPGSIALLRCMVAALCMSTAYLCLPERKMKNIKDKILLFLSGAIGIGCYHLTLNHGEVSVESGMASFIISSAPVFTAIFAIVFLGERINKLHISGLVISIVGVLFIAAGEKGGFNWDPNLGYILLATVAGSIYTVLQKPFVGQYHIVEVTTFAIWGGTFFLMLYYPALLIDMRHAPMADSATVIYLGIFPTAAGYLAWNFVLTEMTASRAVTFLYFVPFIATLLGWFYLGEVPAMISFVGGTIAILGVWMVNRAYKVRTVSISHRHAEEVFL